MTDPNVLQLIGSFHEGGTETQSTQLARLLHESGRYRLHVACLDGDGVLRPQIDALGLGDVPEYRLTSFYDRNAAAQLRRFVRYLRTNEIDLVHTHDFYTNVFGMAAAAIARTPVRIASRRETTGTRTRAQKAVERSAYRAATAIVANAGRVRDQLVREGVRDGKIVTIYNGIDLHRVAPSCDSRDAAFARLGLEGASNRRVVSMVANFRLRVKDHPTFLRAARSVAERAPDVLFLLAGEGELLDEIRSLAVSLGIGERTRFLGRCGAVGDLLAASDVCVLSSSAEGFSNSILEYMAAGRPVVATDVGGAREAVIDGETGFLVPSGDPAAMAARLVELLDDPERGRTMGERGRLLVTERFSTGALLRRVEALYDELLRRRRAAAVQATIAHRDDVSGVGST